MPTTHSAINNAMMAFYNLSSLKTSWAVNSSRYLMWIINTTISATDWIQLLKMPKSTSLSASFPKLFQMLERLGILSIPHWSLPVLTNLILTAHSIAMEMKQATNENLKRFQSIFHSDWSLTWQQDSHSLYQLPRLLDKHQHELIISSPFCRLIKSR